MHLQLRTLNSSLLKIKEDKSISSIYLCRSKFLFSIVNNFNIITSLMLLLGENKFCINHKICKRILLNMVYLIWAVFQNSLPALKIYRIHYVQYGFSALAVNFGTQPW